MKKILTSDKFNLTMKKIIYILIYVLGLILAVLTMANMITNGFNYLYFLGWLLGVSLGVIGRINSK